MKKNYLLVFAICLLCQHVQAQSINKSFTYDGQTREYIMYLPAGYTPSAQMPLLLCLHGLGDTPANFQGVGFDAIADLEGFIPVYPAALGSFLGNAWNSGTPLNTTVDDVGFLSTLIDSMVVNYNVDPSRVYSTGFSMGGIMSNRLGCELSDKIAAIASGSGTIAIGVGDNCNPSRKVPMLHVHGTDDGTVPYAGSSTYGLKSVDETIALWQQLNGSPATADYTMLPDIANDGITVERFDYGNCSDPSEVVLYKATGMAHSWMFIPNNDMHQSLVIWDFLSCHSLLPTNIEGTISSIDIALFPNPVNADLHIQFSQPQSGTVQIFDALGQSVLSPRPFAETSNIDLPVQDLADGVYFLTVFTGNDSHSRIFVKSAY